VSPLNCHTGRARKARARVGIREYQTLELRFTSVALRLWILSSLAEPVIGPAHRRARWLAPQNDNRMRLKSGIWVAAYIRRCQIEGAQALLRRRGADEAGAVFVKISRFDGTADVFGPAPQSAFDETRPADRAFVRCTIKQPTSEHDAEAYLARQLDFDPDIWIVEVEDRAGRNFLDAVVS